MVWDTLREAFETAGHISSLSSRHYWCAPAGTTGIDGSIAYTSATTLTVSSLGWTFYDDNIVCILQIPSGGGTIIVHADKSQFSVTGAVITVADAAFGGTDAFHAWLIGEDAAPAAIATAISAGDEVDDDTQTHTTASTNFEDMTGFDGAATKNVFSFEIINTDATATVQRRYGTGGTAITIQPGQSYVENIPSGYYQVIDSGGKLQIASSASGVTVNVVAKVLA
jgi:hypothetical protein